MLPRVWVLLPGLKRNMNTKGANTIMNMIHTFGLLHIVPWHGRADLRSVGRSHPDKKDVWENAQAYLKKLQALDQAYQDAGVERCETKNFCDSAFIGLGLWIKSRVAISGFHLIASLLLHRLRELDEYIKKMISRSFTLEENASKSLAKLLSSEAGVELAVLNPFGKLDGSRNERWRRLRLLWRKNLKA